MVKKIAFRITRLVVRCPHCKKLFRVAVALVEEEKKEPVEPEVVEDNGL